MRLAIFGKTGQLARALKVKVNARGYEAVFFDRQTCDLIETDKIIEASLAGIAPPDVVIIAAAYTHVDAAESDADTAFAVNAAAPQIIAEWCADRDVPLVYISTDYIFEGGAGSPYAIDAKTEPASVYGASKLMGEQGVLGSGARASIIRTSWVFDGTGANFLTTMLRLAQSHETLNVVDDQIGRPTYAGHLAEAVLTCALSLKKGERKAESVFHVSGSGTPISWADFARAIFDGARSGLNHDVDVISIPSSAYPTAAARPLYSVLDISHFEETFDHSLPSWSAGLEEALRERKTALQR